MKHCLRGDSGWRLGEYKLVSDNEIIKMEKFYDFFSKHFQMKFNNARQTPEEKYIIINYV